jgi:hypothetical protein
VDNAHHFGHQQDDHHEENHELADEYNVNPDEQAHYSGADEEFDAE